MPVLPVPMIIALVLGAFLVHRLVARETHVTLLALIAACAVQSAIIALVQYYGVTELRPVRPVLAMCIPPIAWFAFAWASGGEVTRFRMALHALGPLLAIALLPINPRLLDLIIPLSFAGYGVAILLHLGQGEDSLQHSKLESGAVPLLAWCIVALALLASAGCDVLISYGLAFGNTFFLLWLPSVVSSLSLFGLGVLSLSSATESKREPETPENASSPEDVSRDLGLIAKLDEHMAQQKLFLDPDLTLARLARRLVVPAKQLSAAINRVKGENVSRYINALRIEEAVKRMAQGQSVTSAMFDSGFNTKSNFNREFLRVKRMNPSSWLEQTRAVVRTPAQAQ